MANRTVFAGWYRARDFFFGGPLIDVPPPMTIISAPSATGAGSVTTSSAQIVLRDGTTAGAFSTNAPLLVGSGSNQETVTPSAVQNNGSVIPGNGGFTATFSNLHGQGDPVASATAGLQEAINAADAAGGGVVVVDSAWSKAGGTSAMISAAVLPADGNVSIIDNRAGGGGEFSTLTVLIPNAQVKTNNSVPTVILPAPGAGNMWDIGSLVVENKFLTAAFANGGAMALYYGTTSAGVLASGTIAATFLTSPAASQMIKVLGALASALASGVLNEEVVFTNPTADFITGGGSLILKVQYRLLTGF
jgi:hypothetical protein